jgi:hypothetical protein
LEFLHTLKEPSQVAIFGLGELPPGLFEIGRGIRIGISGPEEGLASLDLGKGCGAKTVSYPFRGV